MCFRSSVGSKHTIIPTVVSYVFVSRRTNDEYEISPVCRTRMSIRPWISGERWRSIMAAVSPLRQGRLFEDIWEFGFLPTRLLPPPSFRRYPEPEHAVDCLALKCSASTV